MCVCVLRREFVVFYMQNSTWVFFTQLSQEIKLAGRRSMELWSTLKLAGGERDFHQLRC